MKAFIFIFALVACLMLAQSTPVDETTDGPAGVEMEMPLLKAVPGKQCQAIGSLCSHSEECCSLRCLSYRQRCVT